MTRKLPRSKRKALGITLKPNDALWIKYQIHKAGLEQQQIAIQAGVSPSLVTKVLGGKKNSPRVKSAIVAALGYQSWEHLILQARSAA